MLLTCHTKHFHSMTAVQTIEADHHMVLWFFKKRKQIQRDLLIFSRIFLCCFTSSAALWYQMCYSRYSLVQHAAFP